MFAQTHFARNNQLARKQKEEEKDLWRQTIGFEILDETRAWRFYECEEMGRQWIGISVSLRYFWKKQKISIDENIWKGVLQILGRMSGFFQKSLSNVWEFEEII